MIYFIVLIMLIFTPTSEALQIQPEVILEKLDPDEVVRLNEELRKINNLLRDAQKRIETLEAA